MSMSFMSQVEPDDDYEIIDVYSGGMVQYYAVPAQRSEADYFEEDSESDTVDGGSIGAPVEGAVQFRGDTTMIVQIGAEAGLATPPHLGEKLLILVLPKKYRDSQVGDLAEDFARYRSKHGMLFTRIWYWKEVAREVWFAMPKPFRWSLYAFVGEIVRRHLGIHLP
jgi:hypothetical protein